MNLTATGILVWVIPAGIAAGLLNVASARVRHHLLSPFSACTPVSLWLGAAGALVCLLAGSLPAATASALLAGTWRTLAGAWARRSLAARGEINGDGALTTVTGTNLLITNTEHDQVRGFLARENTEVVVTLETSPEMIEHLRTHLTGYRLLCVGEGFRGEMTCVWARTGSTAVVGPALRTPTGSLPSVILPDGTLVQAVHLHAPVSRTHQREWEAELDALAELASRETRLVLIGDFNAALEHPRMRTLGRYATDAALIAGRFPERTWPVRGFKRGRGRLVRIFGLDHAMLGRGTRLGSYETRLVPGSDHLALRVSVGAA